MFKQKAVYLVLLMLYAICAYGQKADSTAVLTHANRQWLAVTAAWSPEANRASFNRNFLLSEGATINWDNQESLLVGLAYTRTIGLKQRWLISAELGYQQTNAKVSVVGYSYIWRNETDIDGDLHDRALTLNQSLEQLQWSSVRTSVGLGWKVAESPNEDIRFMLWASIEPSWQFQSEAGWEANASYTGNYPQFNAILDSVDRLQFGEYYLQYKDELRQKLSLYGTISPVLYLRWHKDTWFGIGVIARHTLISPLQGDALQKPLIKYPNEAISPVNSYIDKVKWWEFGGQIRIVFLL